MKKFLIAALAFMFTVGLSACNTVKGFGKDVERGGEKVQGASEKASQ